MTIIDMPVSFPTEADWNELEEGFKTILPKYSGVLEGHVINGKCNVFLKKMEDEHQSFDEDNNLSYTLIILSAYHKNEFDNVYTKLQSSCANLIKAGIAENNNRINCILAKVPLSISLDKCVEWTNNYFDDYPDDPISCVFYYQPSVVSSFSDNSSHINHSIDFAYRKRYDAFAKSNHALHFYHPVGTHCKTSTLLKFVNEEGVELGFNDRYLFQTGEHYYIMKQDSSGAYWGEFHNQGSGIRNHLILNRNGNKFTFQGIFPPSLDLLIL
jgi:hypothetical protein